MKQSFLLLLLVFLFGGVGFAQGSLSVDSITDFNVPDSVNYGASSSFTAVVNLANSTPFTGDVYLLVGVDSSAGTQSVDTITRSVVNKMNDTINFAVTEIYDNLNGYRKGGNVVVIWPIASSLSTSDTMHTNVHVREMVGIGENVELYQFFTIYPNPTQNFIFIQNSGYIKTIEHVRIIGVNGKVVLTEKFATKLDVSFLNRGIYFMDLILTSGEQLHYQIIKE